MSTPRVTASWARASLRAVSSGSPWSQSSTATSSAAEGLDEPVELAAGRGRAGGGEGGGDRALAAPGQDDPVPAVAVPAVVAGQVLEGAGGPALLPAGEVGLGDGPAQAGVPLGVAGQDHQVGAERVGRAGAAPPTARRPPG